ncbi:sugar transporter ERD6-like 4 [Magnolia sinica]|uniref:sugar transporter ERD6-like 4 n=1 Tax=Magnolia sinica TaxID=86752 RepID=UPI002658935B|nr:sugar transporter ERD6-like 4 [Magnolia sinica]XP_058085401.1 sugar transporter ERD6-like 4 [Magnolia sinica]XP_058085402.1 sugar transporter ERD6-like 4 [Magnolia sinica]XP_058085403.1 sugar transporter ERD6-like 4 [Magnolia sinica]XP_058085405.1 sugar transporter ERD6-like 4 [Magnolia sinica]XP_058085406.1 sugar transporter ERD6-like 4 [Magnolia sinica]
MILVPNVQKETSSGGLTLAAHLSDSQELSSDVATFGVGAIQVVEAYFCLGCCHCNYYLVDKAGRHILHIVSSSGMTLSLLFVAVAFY